MLLAEDILAVYPNHLMTLRILAYSAFLEKDYSKSQETYTNLLSVLQNSDVNAIEKSSYQRMAYWTLALLAYRERDYQEAVEYQQKYIYSLFKPQASEYHVLSRNLLFAKQYEEAVIAAQESRSLNPESSLSARLLFHGYLLQDKRDEARQVLKQYANKQFYKGIYQDIEKFEETGISYPTLNRRFLKIATE